MECVEFWQIDLEFHRSCFMLQCIVGIKSCVIYRYCSHNWEIWKITTSESSRAEAWVQQQVRKWQELWFCVWIRCRPYGPALSASWSWARTPFCCPMQPISNDSGDNWVVVMVIPQSIQFPYYLEVSLRIVEELNMKEVPKLKESHAPICFSHCLSNWLWSRDHYSQ